MQILKLTRYIGKVNKAELLEKIRATLKDEHAAILASARAAHEAATNDESKAEDQYDTRGLEASYLAGAQAQRAAEVEKAITAFQALEAKELSLEAPIVAGALVELEDEATGKRSYCFLAPTGGGMNVSCGGASVQVISTASPLGEELLGQRAGGEVEIQARGQTRSYAIVSVT